MLCDAVILSNFFVCSVWYRNLNEELKTKMQIAQNKCIRLCLKLDERHQKFESINWLPVYRRVYQCINAVTFKFVNNACPHYLNDIYEYLPQCRIEWRSNFAKLKGWKAFDTLVPLCGTICWIYEEKNCWIKQSE